MKTICTIMTVAFALTWANETTLFAGELGEKSETKYASVLAAVSTPDLPLTAAQLVKQADAKGRAATTIAVVSAAVKQSPASAPLVVGTISKTTPDVAAIAAATAAAMKPRQASEIARAATMAAPGEASKICYAVCKVAPGDYRSILAAVQLAAPSASGELAKAVGAAVPSVRSSFDMSAPLYGAAPASSANANLAQANATSFKLVSASLEAQPNLVLSPKRLVKGPTIDPPYWPIDGTVTNVPPGDSTNVPPGGRNYAQP